MKQILAILVKDARRFWPEILICQSLLVAFVLVYPTTWRVEDNPVGVRSRIATIRRSGANRLPSLLPHCSCPDCMDDTDCARNSLRQACGQYTVLAHASLRLAQAAGRKVSVSCCVFVRAFLYRAMCPSARGWVQSASPSIWTVLQPISSHSSVCVASHGAGDPYQRIRPLDADFAWRGTGNCGNRRYRFRRLLFVDQPTGLNERQAWVWIIDLRVNDSGCRDVCAAECEGGLAYGSRAHRRDMFDEFLRS